MISTILAGLALPAASSARPPCPPSQWGARTGAVSPIKGMPRGKPATRSGRTPKPVIVAEGDILCGGEVVTNPAGSAVRVAISLPSGKEILLDPRQQASVPYPGLITRLAAFVGRFDSLFAADSHERSGTLGPKDELDGANEREVSAVPRWGPWLMAWSPSSSHDGPWRVFLRGNDRSMAAMVAKPFARIDLRAHCAEGCQLTVTGRAGGIVARRRILTVGPSGIPLPNWLDGFNGSTEERALLGGWLAHRLGDPAWTEQGLALMWSAACAYPAVFEDLSRHLAGMAPGETCRSRPISFKARR